MKNFKILKILFVALIMLGLAFISCSNEDNDRPTSTKRPSTTTNPNGDTSTSSSSTTSTSIQQVVTAPNEVKGEWYVYTYNAATSTLVVDLTLDISGDQVKLSSTPPKTYTIEPPVPTGTTYTTKTISLRDNSSDTTADLTYTLNQNGSLTWKITDATNPTESEKISIKKLGSVELTGTNSNFLGKWRDNTNDLTIDVSIDKIVVTGTNTNLPGGTYYITNIRSGGGPTIFTVLKVESSAVLTDITFSLSVSGDTLTVTMADKSNIIASLVGLPFALKRVWYSYDTDVSFDMTAANNDVVIHGTNPKFPAGTYTFVSITVSGITNTGTLVVKNGSNTPISIDYVAVMVTSPTSANPNKLTLTIIGSDSIVVWSPKKIDEVPADLLGRWYASSPLDMTVDVSKDDLTVDKAGSPIESYKIKSVNTTAKTITVLKNGTGSDIEVKYEILTNTISLTIGAGTTDTLYRAKPDKIIVAPDTEFLDGDLTKDIKWYSRAGGITIEVTGDTTADQKIKISGTGTDSAGVYNVYNVIGYKKSAYPQTIIVQYGSSKDTTTDITFTVTAGTPKKLTLTVKNKTPINAINDGNAHTIVPNVLLTTDNSNDKWYTQDTTIDVTQDRVKIGSTAYNIIAINTETKIITTNEGKDIKYNLVTTTDLTADEHLDLTVDTTSYTAYKKVRLKINHYDVGLTTLKLYFGGSFKESENFKNYYRGEWYSGDQFSLYPRHTWATENLVTLICPINDIVWQAVVLDPGNGDIQWYVAAESGTFFDYNGSTKFSENISGVLSSPWVDKY